MHALREVISDFGYYDYAHFSKDFQLCLGVNPAQYQQWLGKHEEARRAVRRRAAENAWGTFAQFKDKDGNMYVLKG